MHFGASIGPATVTAAVAASTGVASLMERKKNLASTTHTTSKVPLAVRPRRSALGDMTNGSVANVPASTNNNSSNTLLKRVVTKEADDAGDARAKRVRTSSNTAQSAHAQKETTSKPSLPQLSNSSANLAVRARATVASRLRQQQPLSIANSQKRPAWNQHVPAKHAIIVPPPSVSGSVLPVEKKAPPPSSAKPVHSILKSSIKQQQHSSHNLRESTKQATASSLVSSQPTKPHTANHTTTHARHHHTAASAMEVDGDADMVSHQHTTSAQTRVTVQESTTILVQHKEAHHHTHTSKPAHQQHASHTKRPAVAAAVPKPLTVYNPRLHNSTPPQDPIIEYADEIFEYMREMEMKTLPNPQYMTTLQPHLTWPMRKMLVDWLHTLHTKLKLLPETLYLTINLLDRFMSLKPGVSVEKFQLVGVTALFVAAKYEEIMVPSVQVLVHMVGGGYTADEILKAERFMLGVFGFGVGYNGPCSFLRRVGGKVADVRCGLLARYFCECSLLGEVFVGVPVSMVVASAVYLGRKVLGVAGEWNAECVKTTGYAETQLVGCAKALYEVVSEVGTEAGVFIKYADAKYSHVATFVKEFTLRNVANC
ncbi:hypothetical protein BCR33DRAFT_720733 [Rhizoclosmatium globosum]|uniref:Uncharacterized protein n=1 Tax=Rhizoclosmatium globosum TaxID=329046 RepID=A0A1Y2BUQ0_9FUNG|nr:hypothetical protein BCR33DRAFT_720733 [Rhizoclosmatium globosum]|eukprot:ORY38367.1 hypothetical protein BCR33DRAFT_720733 [Rhizoclosmatium globosum]